MAIKDSIGGWKDNAFVYSSPKACTTLKTLMGKQWPLFLQNFRIKDARCPITPVINNFIFICK